MGIFMWLYTGMGPKILLSVVPLHAMLVVSSHNIPFWLVDEKSIMRYPALTIKAQRKVDYDNMHNYLLRKVGNIYIYTHI